MGDFKITRQNWHPKPGKMLHIWGNKLHYSRILGGKKGQNREGVTNASEAVDTPLAFFVKELNSVHLVTPKRDRPHFDKFSLRDGKRITYQNSSAIMPNCYRLFFGYPLMSFKPFKRIIIGE